MRNCWKPLLISLPMLLWVQFLHATKPIFGRVEKIYLSEHHSKLSAKMDTGAQSSSLNAKHIEPFHKNGKTYLRFIIPNISDKIWFTGEYVGDIKIKSRADEKHILPSRGAPLIRPVVLMPIQLGTQIKTIRVNLANRQRFIYPFLMGREAIVAFNGVIDPSLKFTQKYD